MKITVTGKVTKLCPFVDEVDHGTVTLTFEASEAPEMHGVARFLTRWAGERVSHEDFTRMVREEYDPHGCIAVESTWQTAGLDVRCAG